MDSSFPAAQMEVAENATHFPLPQTQLLITERETFAKVDVQNLKITKLVIMKTTRLLIWSIVSKLTGYQLPV
jgi:hypothetical protein